MLYIDGPTQPIHAVRPHPRRQWLPIAAAAAVVGALAAALLTIVTTTNTVAGTPTAAAGPVVAAPSSTAAPQALADQIMLRVIRDHTAVTDTDARIIGLASATCTNLDRHPTPLGALGTIAGMQDVTGWTADDAAFVVGVAVANRCPRHADLFN